MNKYILIIEGEDPSADSHFQNTKMEMTVEQEKELKVFLNKVVEALKANDKKWMTSEHLWDDDDFMEPCEMYSDYFTTKEQIKLDRLVPYGEQGIESIRSIKLVKIESEEEFLLGK